MSSPRTGIVKEKLARERSQLIFRIYYYNFDPIQIGICLPLPAAGRRALVNRQDLVKNNLLQVQKVKLKLKGEEVDTLVPPPNHK